MERSCCKKRLKSLFRFCILLYFYSHECACTWPLVYHNIYIYYFCTVNAEYSRITSFQLSGGTSKPAQEVHVDKSLVQINVSKEELEQRIQNFIKNKREQANINNIHDFIPSKKENETEDEETCARVRTQFVRRTDSKSHLKGEIILSIKIKYLLINL